MNAVCDLRVVDKECVHALYPSCNVKHAAPLEGGALGGRGQPGLVFRSGSAGGWSLNVDSARKGMEGGCIGQKRRYLERLVLVFSPWTKGG